MPLSRHGNLSGNKLTHNSHQGTLSYSCLSSLSHCWLILALKSAISELEQISTKKKKKAGREWIVEHSSKNPHTWEKSQQPLSYTHSFHSYLQNYQNYATPQYILWLHIWMTKYDIITQLNRTHLALLKHFTSGKGKQTQCMKTAQYSNTWPKLLEVSYERRLQHSEHLFTMSSSVL